MLFLTATNSVKALKADATDHRLGSNTRNIMATLFQHLQMLPGRTLKMPFGPVHGACNSSAAAVQNSHTFLLSHGRSSSELDSNDYVTRFMESYSSMNISCKSAILLKSSSNWLIKH